MSNNMLVVSFVLYEGMQRIPESCVMSVSGCGYDNLPWDYERAAALYVLKNYPGVKPSSIRVKHVGGDIVTVDSNGDNQEVRESRHAVKAVCKSSF